jgi:hypothetical protein
MGYKEAPDDEARRQFARRVGALFAVYLTGHRACIEAALGGPVDLVLPVPSSARPGRAPLDRVEGLDVAAVAAFGHPARWLPSALGRGTGAIGHMHPNAQAFAVPPPHRDAVRQARVVLLDDTYVSGSRAQSAAAALRLARARSVVIVPLGRVVRPERFAAHAALVARGPLDDGHRAACLLPQIRAARG